MLLKSVTYGLNVSYEDDIWKSEFQYMFIMFFDVDNKLFMFSSLGDMWP